MRCAIRTASGPLTLGKLGDAYVVSSETCALDLIDATWIRDVEPGEMLVIGPDGLQSFHPFPPRPVGALHLRARLFRAAGFVRVRAERERGADGVRPPPGARAAGVADVVVPIPDSGVCAATGFAEESGVPAADGADPESLRRPDVHRAAPVIRHFGVRVKLNPVRSILQGRRVVLVDDSIVRGTTSRKIVKMVRAAGATEVHMRISCPPTISPCFYGVDTPRRSELIAATHSLEEIRRYIGADSLGYLSVDGLLASVGTDAREPTARRAIRAGYPVAFPRNEAAYLQLALKLVE